MRQAGLLLAKNSVDSRRWDSRLLFYRLLKTDNNLTGNVFSPKIQQDFNNMQKLESCAFSGRIFSELWRNLKKLYFFSMRRSRTATFSVERV